MALSVEFQLPLGTTVYQIKCPECGASYGLLMETNEDYYPRFCAFCMHRTGPIKTERRD